MTKADQERERLEQIALAITGDHAKARELVARAQPRLKTKTHARGCAPSAAEERILDDEQADLAEQSRTNESISGDRPDVRARAGRSSSSVKRVAPGRTRNRTLPPELLASHAQPQEQTERPKQRLMTVFALLLPVVAALLGLWQWGLFGTVDETSPQLTTDAAGEGEDAVDPAPRRASGKPPQEVQQTIREAGSDDAEAIAAALDALASLTSRGGGESKDAVDLAPRRERGPPPEKTQQAIREAGSDDVEAVAAALDAMASLTSRRGGESKDLVEPAPRRERDPPSEETQQAARETDGAEPEAIATTPEAMVSLTSRKIGKSENIGETMIEPVESKTQSATEERDEGADKFAVGPLEQSLSEPVEVEVPLTATNVVEGADTVVSALPPASDPPIENTVSVVQEVNDVLPEAVVALPAGPTVSKEVGTHPAKLADADFGSLPDPPSKPEHDSPAASEAEPPTPVADRARVVSPPLEPVQAPAASIPAAPSSERERVFVHYTRNDAAARAKAEAAAERSRAAGFDVVELRDVAFPISQGNLRFFFVDDRRPAETLADALEATSDQSERWRVRDFTHYDSLPRAGTLEVWIPQ